VEIYFNSSTTDWSLKKYALVTSDGGNWNTAWTLPLASDLGTYTVIVRNGTLATSPILPSRCHFGVWNLDRAEYQRTQKITAKGGGAKPASTVTVEFWAPDASSPTITKTTSSDPAGRWTIEWNTRNDTALGTWTAKLSVTKTYDSPNPSFSDEKEFTIKKATIAIGITTDKASYQRTETIRINATATYPNGTSIKTSVPVKLNMTVGTTRLLSATSMTYNTTIKKWTYSYKIKINDPTGTYSIVVYTIDPNGNNGSATKAVPVSQLTYVVTLETDKNAYQRTESIQITTSVKHPNGTVVGTGSVTATIKKGATQISGLALLYNAAAKTWGGSYQVRAFDPIGDWNITVLVKDAYNNNGSATKIVTVSAAQLTVSASSNGTTYQRTQTIQVTANIRYPNGTSLSVGSVNATMKIGASTVVQVPLTYSLLFGDWEAFYQIRSDDPTGGWTILFEAKDGYANTGSTTTQITVARATLQVVAMLDKSEYQRTETAQIQAIVRYPNGSSLKPSCLALDPCSSVELDISLGALVLGSQSLQYNTTIDRWVGSQKIEIDDPLGNYTFRVQARDTSDNSGTVETTARIVAATLSVTVWTDRTSYSLVYDTIGIRANATYPDGTLLREGNVSATITSGTYLSNVTLVYDSVRLTWTGSRYLSVTNPIGTYNIQVEATDQYGNWGTASRQIDVQPWYLVMTVAAAIIVVGLIVWYAKRHSRKA
jgi:5-hydroxyisourate hydrolase-like protein (transthyretin family)